MVRMTMSRRERLRASTIDEIKHAALAQIENDGAAALSVRGVARDIGMSPAGLYRYYDGRDALLTELITDAGFTIEWTEASYVGRPKAVSYFTAGVARNPS